MLTIRVTCRTIAPALNPSLLLRLNAPLSCLCLCLDLLLHLVAPLSTPGHITQSFPLSASLSLYPIMLDRCSTLKFVATGGDLGESQGTADFSLRLKGVTNKVLFCEL